MAIRTAQAQGGEAHFLSPRHNHARCAQQAMLAADRICDSNKARFTDMRRAVLTAIWREHKPISAYDLLATLNADGQKHAPVAVYRALDFLLSQGLIHRLASLNAFIGCPAPEKRHDAKFLICRSCQTVAEIDDSALDDALENKIKPSDFQIEHKTVEISGLCRYCRETGRKAKTARRAR